MKSVRTAALLTIALAGSACSADEPMPKKVQPDGSITAITSQDQPLAELAKSVLAETLDIPVTDIVVDSIRPVEWRDGSVGCPQPDRAYPQVITPGHKILLRVGTRTYAVHEANGRAFVCQRKKATTTLTRDLDIAWASKSIEARRDLAERLRVDEKLVVVAGATQTAWPDLSLGCPEPGTEYSPQRVQGYILRLRYGGREFTYHTDLERVFACPEFSAD
ncbi:MAG: hypothetical protein AAFX56_18345 [Pseudomonadota bacterium]